MNNLIRITEIDISKQARALAWLRWTNYWLIMGFGSLAISLLAALLFNTPEDDKVVERVVLLIALLIACPAAYIGWRHLGVIDPAFWWAYLIVFPLLVVLSASDIILQLLVVFSAGEFDISEVVASIIWDIVALIFILPGWISLTLLRRIKITAMGATVAQVLLRLTKNTGLTAVKVTAIRRINKPRGLVIGTAGALVLVLRVLLPMKTGPLLVVLGMLGFILLIRARRYFQLDADSLLAVDPRPPILLLRSFSDDEKEIYVRSDKSLLDFSLETRLSNHFSRFGPFIAIGSPTETVPQLGAARVHLSDAEWQPQVLTWMRDARLIIMYSGKTHWVNWELQQVIKNERITRLILMIPEIKAWRRSKRNKEISSRVEQVREVFKSTQWEEKLLQFDDFAGLRAMLFHSDGSMVMVTSRSRSRDSYHLAALVAQQILIDSDALNN